MNLKIEITDTGLKIDGELENSQLRDYLVVNQDEQMRAEAFLEIIELGLKVKDAIQTSAFTKILEQSISEVRNSLNSSEKEYKEILSSLLNDLTNENSTSGMSLTQKLKKWREDFDKKLADEFDATNTQSILTKIRESLDTFLSNYENAIARQISLNAGDGGEQRPLLQISQQISDLETNLFKSKGADNRRRSSSVAGQKFEDAVFMLVQQIADDFDDIADDPGKQNKKGFDGNNEGDITVDYRFDSIGLQIGRLVIECKHSTTSTSKSKLLSELDKGISNRQANYGILVTNEDGYRFSDNKQFWEDWNSTRAILVVENDVTEIDVNRLRFAYLLAKIRIKDMVTKLDEKQIRNVSESISTISSNLSRISTLRGNITKAKTGMEGIEKDVDYLEEEVWKRIKELHRQLQNEDSSPSTSNEDQGSF